MSDAHARFARLGQFGLLSVRGADATSFLQAQLTNDVNTVDAVGYGGVCNLKGRVLAIFRMLRDESSGGWLLQIPVDVLAPLAARLSMFKLRSKVEIEDISSARQVLGVRGGICAPRGVQAYALEAGRELWIAADEERATEVLLEAGAVLDEDAWLRGEIEARVPWLFSATSEAFLPQMLDMEALGAISFTKGCFPGQEVVARLQHLGEAKRRLFRAQVAGPPPLPATALAVRSGDRQRDAGMALYSAPTDAEPEASQLLAVIPTGFVNEDIFVASDATRSLQLLDANS